MSPSFAAGNLKTLEITANKYFGQFIEGIEQRARLNGGVVEMNEWFHHLIFDAPSPTTMWLIVGRRVIDFGRGTQ